MTEGAKASRHDVAQEGKRQPVKKGLASIVRCAAAQFAELTAKQAEGVTGVRETEDGWSVLLDVVELERVPSTTTVIATYRLDIDHEGELMGYERLRRYVRGAVDPS
ncbi:gas vesicle protein GvpO [Actinopolymorpha pittospori]